MFVQAQEAEAIKGENTARADIAQSNATLAMRQAEADQRGEVARLNAQAEIQRAQALAEAERLNAAEVVRQEIERKKVEIAAEAEAEKIRRHAKGEADATLLRYEAEARGIRQVLESKAAGYESLVRSTGGDARAAATLLMIEKLEQIVEMMRTMAGSGDPVALSSVDLDFHRAVARHSGNELAAQVWESLAQHMIIVFCRDWANAADRIGEVRLHESLIDFLRGGSIDDMDAKLAKHFSAPATR